MEVYTCGHTLCPDFHACLQILTDAVRGAGELCTRACTSHASGFGGLGFKVLGIGHRLSIKHGTVRYSAELGYLQ